jgi:hypothetical protein
VLTLPVLIQGLLGDVMQNPHAAAATANSPAGKGEGQQAMTKLRLGMHVQASDSRLPPVLVEELHTRLQRLGQSFGPHDAFSATTCMDFARLLPGTTPYGNQSFIPPPPSILAV